MECSTLDTAPAFVAALPIFEKQCLAVLAALASPRTRAQLTSELREAGIEHPPSDKPARKTGRGSHDAVTPTELAALLVRWTQQGITFQTNARGGAYACGPEATHALLSDPECREVLERMRGTLLVEPRVRLYIDRTSAIERQLRLARLSLYLAEPGAAESTFALVKQRLYSSDNIDPYRLLLDPRAPAAALRLMSPALQREYLAHVLAGCFDGPSIPSPNMLAAAADLDSSQAPVLRAQAVMLAAISGEQHDPEAWLRGDRSALAMEARAVAALQRGDFDAARALAVQTIVASVGKAKRKYVLLSGPLAPLLTLALATGTPEQVAMARAQLSSSARARKGHIAREYVAIAVFLGVAANDALFELHSGMNHMEILLIGLVFAFVDARAPALLPIALDRVSATCKSSGARWLAAQAAAVSLRLRTPSEPPTSDMRACGGVLLELYRPQAAWERALGLLESLSPSETLPPPPAADPQALPERRLVFLVRLHKHEMPVGDHGHGTRFQPQFQDDSPDFDDDALDLAFEDGYGDKLAAAQVPPPRAAQVAAVDTVTTATLSIEPRLQTRRGNTFTAGRAVALRVLAESTPEMDYLTPEDLRVTAQISSQRTWSGREDYFSARAPLALIGHPRVFWAAQPEGPAVEVVTRPPTLRADRGPNGLRLRVEPYANEAGIGVMVDRDGRLVVSELPLTQRHVQRAVLEQPPIPAEGEARLRQILGRMASLFTIQSQVGVDELAGVLEALPADSRPVVQLVRAEPGLRVRVSVAPLGAAGPSFEPGQGLVTVAAELAGRRVSCQRDLAAESHLLRELLEAAPQLTAALGAQALHLDALPDCLALLHALSTLPDGVHVRWPEGTPLVVVGEADLASLRLTIGERGEWLQATGTLRVDETQVLDMLQVLAQRTAGGRYVALGDDRYLALSEELQQQLSALQAAASITRDKKGAGLRLPPIALGFVSPWLRSLRALGGLKVDARTEAQLERIEHAYESTPVLPKTFDAELRAYQVTGYEFLARLAAFGAGACLADDMGLGKTLMTLALLVSRAASGPALVVSPTSVRANWFDEALRFAPTLRMRRLDGSDGVALETLEAFDVLVCSYTVMTQRIEQLECTRFATVVLDEAQAIKNAATQRATAARRLVADARVGLTGTPVENHLGDLHGIMGFLNPGLLGDARHFEARFGKPIQREGDAAAREQLRALLAPFLLRRRKSEVLRELPARTEITLRIEPEASEQAFSEALRRAALDRLRQSDAARAGSAVSILAEITRLRRAACHPQLIEAEANVGSAKLERLIELAHELREGGHRALVFSQFVDFLRLVQTRVLAEGFTCQYLDGSTPESARKKAVTAFQSGEGDLFLISLKAGGFGLNLTAADYVIHLDPWWNPAVEAQASDRAHRIGQERPVTIYRLVNAASIEERVLALHGRKQALAEELLRDSAEAPRLDPQALMALLED